MDKQSVSLGNREPLTPVPEFKGLRERRPVLRREHDDHHLNPVRFLGLSEVLGALYLPWFYGVPGIALGVQGGEDGGGVVRVVGDDLDARHDLLLIGD